MTTSDILNTIIALAFLFACLSVVVASINGRVSALMGWKATNLRAAIQTLLRNAQTAEGKPVELVFFEHPRIQTLLRQAELGQSGWFGWLQGLAHGFGRRLGNVGRAAVGRPPVGEPAADAASRPAAPAFSLEYIPAEAFVAVLLDCLRRPAQAGPMNVNEIRRNIESLSADRAGDLRAVLRTLTESARDLDDLEAKIAAWYDQTMDQASEWYGRKMRTFAFLVGAAVCLLFDLDAFALANRIYHDRTIQEAIAAQVRQKVEKGELNAAEQEIPKDLFEKLGIRLTWPAEDWEQLLTVMGEQLATPAKWFGLLLSAMAISMGAPFWHDVLTQLVGSKKLMTTIPLSTVPTREPPTMS
jgi:hypothetical protein